MKSLPRSLFLTAAVVVASSAVPLVSRAGVSPSAPSQTGENAFVTRLVGPPQGTPLTGDQLDRRTEAVGREVRCPVCQGSSIADSPSSTARHMKDQVRELLAAGYTDDQIVTYFEASYGEFIRLAPKTRGFDALVWIVPPLLLLIGAAVTGQWLRRRSRRSAHESEPIAEETQDPALDPWLRKVRSLVASGNDAAAGESQ